MKILHTSDWHLGRQFHGQSLEADHDAILMQVLSTIEKTEPDVLIIAGDIYDRASPPVAAVRQFNDFITKFASTSNAALVMIAGNHDSGDRIASIATLADDSRVLICGPLNADEAPLIIEDEDGPVVFSALPFGNEFFARECFGDNRIANPADVLAAQINAARAHVPEGARWVVTAHAFITNASVGESERRLVVGGIETVDHQIFDGAHYVALGHLHRSQIAAVGHIRYSGSPLAFEFDEIGAEKSMTLAELGADGTVSVKMLPFRPIHGMRILTGSFAEILAVATETPSEDFFKIVLTDQEALIDPMRQIRQYYPNAMVLKYERDEVEFKISAEGSTQASLHEPIEVIGDFLDHIRGKRASDEETSLINDALNQLNSEGGGT